MASTRVSAGLHCRKPDVSIRLETHIASADCTRDKVRSSNHQDAQVMRFPPISIVLGIILMPASSIASVDIPLFWKTVSISSDDRGGASVRAALDDSGQLASLDVTIRGKEIVVPDDCLAGLRSPLLSGLSLSFGQWQSGGDYWSLSLPYDGTGSVELGARFDLVFSADALVWSCKAIETAKDVWEHSDVCPLVDPQ